MLAHIVDPLNRRIFDGDVIVTDGIISSITPCPVPDDAPYMLPGFVDSHIHIESTLLTPDHFARLAVPHGTLAVVTDPHEIANVSGSEGIQFMLDRAQLVRFHFSFGVPSCVPSTSPAIESSGANIDLSDVERYLSMPPFYGLAEMMNYPGILSGDPIPCEKVKATLRAGKVVDGHAPGLTGEKARSYVQVGISTDHEIYDIQHARERIALGQKILIREGSAARNFDELIPLVDDPANVGMLMFCTDDIYPDELLQGHINLLVKRAVSRHPESLDHLWNVLHAACVAPVQHYHLPVGLLQPGQSADFILVSDLVNFQVLQTWISGYKVFSSGQIDIDNPSAINLAQHPATLPDTMAVSPLSVDSIAHPVPTSPIPVIVSCEDQLLTDTLLAMPKVEGSNAVSDPDRDILKIVVLRRHDNNLLAQPPAVGFIHGFGLKRGAIASTIAHDCHNIIAVGVSDQDIVQAINQLIKIRGGLCVVDGQNFDSLQLQCGGLMSDHPGSQVAQAHLRLKQKAHQLGCPYSAPFMTLAFMALPVIPKLKITDRGLFDVTKFQFVTPE